MSAREMFPDSSEVLIYVRPTQRSEIWGKNLRDAQDLPLLFASYCERNLGK